jgi:hypothetical protein
MSDYKFEVGQIVFVLPIKKSGVIKKNISLPVDENTYEVEVNYQNRIWKAAFNESELTNIKESLT